VPARAHDECVALKREQCGSTSSALAQPSHRATPPPGGVVVRVISQALQHAEQQH
jgi:hypothetical protein